MDKADMPCQALVRMLAKKPGWKETNFQVSVSARNNGVLECNISSKQRLLPRKHRETRYNFLSSNIQTVQQSAVKYT